MVTELASEPSAPEVVLPSGTDTNDQQVPVQLTRLPTTVDHSRSTGAFGVRPFAVKSTFVLTVPDDEASEALAAAAAREAAVSWSVVFASSVGATLDGPVDLRLRPAVVLRDSEGELLAGAPRDRRLLDVEVLEADRVGDLDRVPCRPGRRRGCARQPYRASSSPSARRRSGCRTAATRRPRTATRRARVRDGDHRPDGPALRADRRRAGDQETALRDLDAVDDGVDVVDAAEVPGRRA